MAGYLSESSCYHRRKVEEAFEEDQGLVWSQFDKRTACTYLLRPKAVERPDKDRECGIDADSPGKGKKKVDC